MDFYVLNALILVWDGTGAIKEVQTQSIVDVCYANPVLFLACLSEPLNTVFQMSSNSVSVSDSRLCIR